ncbi:MAG: LysM peptidoglycan-binding domain-containing protein [Pseudomonadota bacterium]|nr:LysM peptidoglycan-binding domain-containing protein [Pseudomonadota bacterium]
MKKTGHKPAYGQEGQTGVSERRSASGLEGASIRRIETSVDWEIPGDVPEQERRSIYPYAPVVKLESKWTSLGDSSARAGITQRSSAAQTPAPGKTHIGEIPNRRSVFPILGLLALSLLLGLGGLGYMHFVGENDTSVTANLEYVELVEKAALQDVPGVMQAALSDVSDKQTMPDEQSVQLALAETTVGVSDVLPQTRIITHVVKKGDTLWDIAEHYVNDPFKYPEIAELSEIENPDLIYPGEIVRIRV